MQTDVLPHYLILLRNNTAGALSRVGPVGPGGVCMPTHPATTWPTGKKRAITSRDLEYLPCCPGDSPVPPRCKRLLRTSRLLPPLPLGYGVGQRAGCCSQATNS